jgi:hypothetical protein
MIELPRKLKKSYQEKGGLPAERLTTQALASSITAKNPLSNRGF